MCSEKDILEWCFIFFILERYFAYRISIPKIFFVYGILILESSKIIKDNCGIA